MASASAPPSKPTLFGTIVVVSLVLVLAWQLAHWTWVLIAPAPRASAPEARSDVDFAAIARLFGAAAPGEASAPTAAGSLRLKGVIAPTPGVEASAIFSVGTGKDAAV
jgi:general secretion pathway protein C